MLPRMRVHARKGTFNRSKTEYFLYLRSMKMIGSRINLVTQVTINYKYNSSGGTINLEFGHSETW